MTDATPRARAEEVVQKLIREAAAERDADWAVAFHVLPVRVFRAIVETIEAEVQRAVDGELASLMPLLLKASQPHKGNCSYLDDGVSCSCGALDATILRARQRAGGGKGDTNAARG